MGLSLKKFQYLSNGEKYEILWRKLHKKAESKQAGIQGSFSKKSQKGKIPPNKNVWKLNVLFQRYSLIDR